MNTENIGKKDERNLYLKNEDLDVAVARYLALLSFEKVQEKGRVLPVIESQGWVTSEPVFAKISSPYYNASAMDGICVDAMEMIGVDERHPKILIKGNDFNFVDTGDVITDPYNAVVMIEDVIIKNDDEVSVNNPVSLWQNVRPIGEDIVAGELIIPAFHRIRPIDLGALLAGGITEIEVMQKPQVGIIPTGTELVEAGEAMAVGKIVDSNTHMFVGLVKEYGGAAQRYPTVRDEYELIKNAIIKAVDENDMVLISAGSSAGTEDYTRKLIEELGEVVVHGVAIKPGKPVVLGLIQGKPVIGIPGYPVSAYFVFESFVKPVILAFNHQTFVEGVTIKAVLSKRLMSSLKYLEFVRMKCGRVNDQFVATPLDRGAGVTMSLVNADGILKIPKNVEGYEVGEEVELILMRPREEIENTLVSIGSHDVLMDIISNIIHKNKKLVNLSSAHVGSLGGIMAIKKGECHIAPIHLLDEETGIYNLAYLKRYLADDDVVLIKGVKRTQGMIIPKGNPKNIQGIEDLIRDDISFVNRQRGSGTRVLLDYLLKTAQLDANQVLGYSREMNTHMMVASAVKSGSCDVGIGVLSAANMMELDFIPIGDEAYDFVILKENLRDPRVQIFIKVLKSQEFKDALKRLGGYGLEQPGEIVEP
ncbi:molybdopterin biosynthesis protein [Acetobacterium sp.]|uniref:molybdopterin biosynthesis protein n=1 Tax=Acetobacterium sp. TaxID=1872094 RepID=UPI000CA7FE4B|nr:molybdopterin biosynthesis protein [Acetobacterium sp.]MDO9493409.1 molybdopterin biosynthesis protein [Acetobacterium sp.]PKM71358.1 MAG: molybdopterin biosynthesis protein [Firmicutes bacterium HGW-Firmicutes-17]